MSNHHAVAIVRVRLFSHSVPLPQYAVEQGQVRENAPKSAVFTPALSDLLGRWNKSTDQATSLYQQEEVLVSQLRQTREGRRQAARQAHLDEVAFVGGAEAVAQNNPEALRSLGLLLQQPPTGKAQALPPITPTGLTVKPGADPGTLHLAWKKSPGTHSYEVQYSLDPATDASWVTAPPQGKRSLRLGDLRPGAAYLVRVRATGTGGSSVYSDAARGTAR